MSYYTTSRLSENMEFTPEGYLLCKAVPIARTGAMEYLPEEVPAEVAKDASGPTVLVYREAADVFSPETMASYEGKDVTVDHPEDFVTPLTWRELTAGHAQNVRQGEGKDSDLLLADLLIKDQDTIDLILPPEDGGSASASGKPEEPLREVSCGYDAAYEVIAPGIGKQTNIIGNHIALVPHGRCGSRCAIKDAAGLCPERTWGATGGEALHHLFIKEPHMAKLTNTPGKKPGWWDRIMGNPKVKKAMDEAAAIEAAKDEGADPENKPDPDKEQQAATDSDEKLDEILMLLRSLLDALKSKDSDTAADNEEGTGGAASASDNNPEKTGDEDPEKTGDEDPNAEEGEKTKTGDKAARARTADRAVIARAGVLAPGLRFLTGDSACMVKRASLRQAMGDKAVARVVDSCLRGTALDKADCVTLDSAFMAASEVVRARNNDRTGVALSGARHKDATAGGPTTPADINKANKEFYDSQSKKE